MSNPLRRPRARREPFWTLSRRRWIYGVAVAAVPVALSYGIATGDQLAALLMLAAAVLGVSGSALAHPTSD